MIDERENGFMKRLMVTAALAAFAFAGAAYADDVEGLKAQAVETCKKEVGDMPDGDKLCGCMIDNIVTAFGDDAEKMLKVLAANLNPSDTAEIATLLGISEDEAKSFVEAADEKMDKVQEACMPAQE